ncbi:UNVERIFIED_CONTAM: hypothetical protein GTU68_040313 [Idotea baltica]|nr:hypothetical protein [Idotea baltica]
MQLNMNCIFYFEGEWKVIQREEYVRHLLILAMFFMQLAFKIFTYTIEIIIKILVCQMLPIPLAQLFHNAGSKFLHYYHWTSLFGLKYPKAFEDMLAIRHRLHTTYDPFDNDLARIMDYDIWTFKDFFTTCMLQSIPLLFCDTEEWTMCAGLECYSNRLRDFFSILIICTKCIQLGVIISLVKVCKKCVYRRIASYLYLVSLSSSLILFFSLWRSKLLVLMKIFIKCLYKDFKYYSFFSLTRNRSILE